DTADGRARFGLTEEDVPGARELRESLRATLLAHAGHPAHAPVTPLGELLATAPLRVTIDPADGSAGLASAYERSADDASAEEAPAEPAPVEEVPAEEAPIAPGRLHSRIAEAVAAALIAGTWQRLKSCEAATCHWAYYDRSPAGRGRWCSMQVCGARAKMRRYRAK
ncbi:MAG: CGNR zinc finger domain-containing protein, partial [Streptomyces sp.]|nr:CGNR zinc finger domain-containing protein [Streptomyces sp.]